MRAGRLVVVEVALVGGVVVVVGRGSAAAARRRDLVGLGPAVAGLGVGAVRRW